MNESSPKTYLIPVNFIDEGSIFRGMLKLRNFLEAIFVTAVVFILLFITTRNIQMIAFFCCLIFGIFAVGIQGEPVSRFLINAFQWKKRKGVMLYNGNVTPLAKSPLDAMMETSTTQEALIKMGETIRDRFKDQGKDEVYIEGETFRFMEDKTLKGIQMEPVMVEEPIENTVKKEASTLSQSNESHEIVQHEIIEFDFEEDVSEPVEDEINISLEEETIAITADDSSDEIVISLKDNLL